jgi:hypothetical protein
MLDNMTVTKQGKILLQEDPGNQRPRQSDLRMLRLGCKGQCGIPREFAQRHDSAADSRRAQSARTHLAVAVHHRGRDARARRPGFEVVAFIAMAGGNDKATASRKEPANYWFDRRHVEQFELRVQSFRTIEGESLTLIRLLDPRMIEIYG